VADAEDDMAEDPEMNKDSAASEEKQK
jgi:hypothetical protein